MFSMSAIAWVKVNGWAPPSLDISQVEIDALKLIYGWKSPPEER
jgi:hypothetical protein